LTLTDVTGPDVKNEFFMGQNAVCRTEWKEANYSDESKTVYVEGRGYS